MFCLPVLKPLSHPIHILLQVLERLAPELVHDVHVIALARLVQNGLHNLALHVLLDLVRRVSSDPVRHGMYVLPIHKSVEKNGVVAAENEDEVEPALREEIDGVVLQHNASLAHDGLQVIEQLRLTTTKWSDSVFCVLVNDQALELLIPA